MRISQHPLTFDQFQVVSIPAQAVPLAVHWSGGQPLLYCQHEGGEATRALNVTLVNPASGDFALKAGQVFLGKFQEEFGQVWLVYTD